MKKTLCTLSVLALIAAPAFAVQIVDYSWEDGGTILGSFGNLSAAQNVSGMQDEYSDGSVISTTGGANSGTNYLMLEERPHDGTPQAYVAYIEGLTGGDQVSASFYGWDSTDGASPSLRVWGHYALNGDVNSYDGSASGNTDFTTGALNGAWSQVDHTWTVDAGKEALVVEVRLYSTPSTANDTFSTFFVDDLHIEAPDGATITVAPEPTSLALLALGALGFIRRR
jgi:hypothetical protein